MFEFQSDYIMREIENITRALSEIIFNKHASATEILDEEGNVTESGLLYLDLKSLMAEGRINEAENILFDAFKQNPNEGLLEVAVRFYTDLNDLSDDDLIDADFSRTEIAEGLGTIKKYYLLSQISQSK